MNVNSTKDILAALEQQRADAYRKGARFDDIWRLDQKIKTVISTLEKEQGREVSLKYFGPPTPLKNTPRPYFVD